MQGFAIHRKEIDVTGPVGSLDEPFLSLAAISSLVRGCIVLLVSADETDADANKENEAPRTVEKKGIIVADFVADTPAVQVKT